MLVAVINGNDGERMLNDVERVLGHCKNNDHLILLIRHSKLRQMHSEGKRAESWRVLEFILNEVYSCAFAYNQTFRSTNPLDWPAIDVVVDGTCGYDVFEKFADSCDWFLSDPGDIARLPLGNYKLIKDLALLPEKANSFTRKQLKNASLFEKEAKIRREIPKEFENIQIPSNHEFVVLGGTFDHFHAGHKILLSMACWLSTKSVCCGISGKFTKVINNI